MPYCEPMETLWTTSDVARRGVVSAETVRMWHRLGRLAAITTPQGQRLFRPEDVEKFLAQRHRRRERRQP
jgi:DNA-binding transcriptional MerR regulator